jgi:hypothetical protein
MMDKVEILKKLEAHLDEASRCRMYGSVEIEITDGAVMLIRTIKTELIMRKRPHYEHRFNGR